MSEAPTPTPTTEAPAAATPTVAAEAPATSTAAALFPEGGVAQPSAAAGVEVAVEPAASEASAEAATETPAEGEPPAEALAPIEYDLKLPESFTVDEGLLTKAKSTFAEAGVPADKAQGLLDLFVEAQSAASAAQLAVHSAQQAEWIAQLNSMPEFSGPTREKSSEAIGKLWDVYGSPEAKAALDAYGAGNNPALAKMMLSIANALNEGAPAVPGRPAPNGKDGRALPKTLGQQLFPNMNA